MSARKSTSSKELGGRLAFQMEQCAKCLSRVLKKNAERHRTDDCENIQEWLRKAADWRRNVEQQFDWDTDLQCDTILCDNFLLSCTFHGLAAEFLPDVPSPDRAVFLAPELMEHFQFEDGQNVTLYVKRDRLVETFVYAAYRFEMPKVKTMFTICVQKKSQLYNTFYPAEQSAGNKALFHMDAAVKTVPLSSIYLDTDTSNEDVLAYLKFCRNAHQQTRGQLFRPDSGFVRVKDTSFRILSLVADRQKTPSSIEGMMESMTLQADNKNVIYEIVDNTEIIFAPLKEADCEPVRMAGYEQQLDDILKLVLHSSEQCQARSLDWSLPRSVLLTGPTGVGKSLAMRQLFARLQGKMNMVRVNASTLLSSKMEFVQFKTIFESIGRLSPSLLFLDNLEDLADERKATEKRVIVWLKELFESLPRSRPVFVVGACTETELLESSLRRHGRFDVEIDFPMPTPAIRKAILELELAKTWVLSDEQLARIAESTHGFTGADLKHLCDMSRLLSLDQTSTGFDALLKVRQTMKPSVMKEISLEKPNVYWADVGGMQAIRDLLEETVVWPIKHPEAFLRMGIEPPRGILMYGPPGCCKTMIGKALATESGLNFFSIKGPELFSKWVGDSERAIRQLFRKARAASPSILFFDEIDALAAERGQNHSAVGDRILAQLLTEMDGVEKLSQVIVIAATNRPDIVDKALLRPGRLDSMIYVPLPDYDTRKEIFRIRTARMPLDDSITREQFLSDLAAKSEGYTGAEVTALCQTAGLAALGQSIHSQSITLEHFEAAFRRVRPRIDSSMIEFYRKFASRSQS